MATIKFDGIEEYARQLSDLGAAAEGICKYAIYDAAGMVADAIKANTPEDTGDLKNSLVLRPMQNRDGFIFTKVVFDGYDSKGVPNAVKANVLESGSSTRQKHPFIRPAVNRVKQAAQFSIETALNKKIEEHMNK